VQILGFDDAVNEISAEQWKDLFAEEARIGRRASRT